MSNFFRFIKNLFAGDETAQPKVAATDFDEDEAADGADETEEYDEAKLRRSAEEMIAESLAAEDEGRVNAEIFRSRASGYLMLDEYEKALDALDQALRIDADSIEACRLKAEIYERTENYEQSKIWCSRAIALHPLVEERMAAEREAESVWRSHPLIKEKMPIYEKLTSRLADFHRSTIAGDYYKRGGLHSELGDHAAAIADFSKVIELNPDCHAYSSRGDAYAAVGELTKALGDFNRSIELEEHWFAFVSRAEIHDQRGDFDAAVRDYTQANALNADDEFGINFYFERGEIYLKKGDYEAALADFNRVIEDDPDFADTYRQRAETYRRMGQSAAARDDDERANLLEESQLAENDEMESGGEIFDKPPGYL